MKKKHCFVSYSSKDKKFAERLAMDLSTNNVSLFFDRWEIKVGDSIVEKINAALGNMSNLIIVLSQESVRSNWVKKELSSAIMKKLSNESVRILPVLIEKCKIPDIINDIKFADFTEAYENGLVDLTNALGVESKPTTESMQVVKPLLRRRPPRGSAS